MTIKPPLHLFDIGTLMSPDVPERNPSARPRTTISKTAKMPCPSFDLPAFKTCPAAQLLVREYPDDAVCLFCYAREGQYVIGTVPASQAARLAWVISSLREDGGVTFLTYMVRYLQKAKQSKSWQDRSVFRVHSAGDLFSPDYINAWRRIVEQVPDVRFWFPTREWMRSSQLPHLQQLAALPNAIVRPSAPTFDSAPPVVPGLANGTMVATSREAAEQHGASICPATSVRDSCGPCRACWDKEGTVAYLLHTQHKRKARAKGLNVPKKRK
jgi:hypothetical protein